MRDRGFDRGGDGGGAGSAGGKGLAEVAVHVRAGDIGFQEVGLARGQDGGCPPEVFHRVGEEAGDQGRLQRSQRYFRRPQDLDLMRGARVGQADGVEQPAAPVDAGGVDVSPVVLDRRSCW